MLPEKVTSTLAAELAMNLASPEDILQRHGITRDEFAVLTKRPEFRNLYAEAKRIWTSETNTGERIRAKAKLALEDALIQLVRMIHQPDSPHQAKIESVKQLARLSGMDTPTPQAQERFSLVIKLPSATAAPAQSITIEGETLALPAEE